MGESECLGTLLSVVIERKRGFTDRRRGVSILSCTEKGSGSLDACVWFACPEPYVSVFCDWKRLDGVSSSV